MAKAALRSSPSVSIVIPTKNAGPHFAETLEAIRRQSIETEIFVVDSGSTDDTVSIAGRFGAKVDSIPPESFNHGGTRNRGIAQSSGRFCVLLVQDALPVGATWLDALLQPFADSRVAAVSGRVEPRPDADAVGCWETLAQRDLLGPSARVSEVRDWNAFETLSREDRLRLVTSNNVSCVLRREAWEELPFSDTAFGEDLDWGLRALKTGRRLAYTPDGVVLHSHTRPAAFDFERLYISGKWVPAMLGYKPQNPNLTGDEQFFRFLGLLLGEVALLLREPLSDPKQFHSYRGRLQWRADSGRRERRELSDYRDHALRSMFYSLLDEVFSSAAVSSREEAEETLAKVLARTLGSFSALYYLDGERRANLSDRMRRLDRSWMKGRGDQDTFDDSSRPASLGPRGEEVGTHPQITRLAERFAGDVGPASAFFFSEAPGVSPAPTSRGRLRRVGDHLTNSGLLSVRSWFHHPFRTAGMAVPLRWKLRLHRFLDRPLFDLSPYARFERGGYLDAEPRIEVAVPTTLGAGRRRQLGLVTPNPCTDGHGLIKDLGRLGDLDQWEVTTIIDRPPEGLEPVSDLVEPDDEADGSPAPGNSRRIILFATSDLIVPERGFFEAASAELARLRPDLGLRGSFGAAEDLAAAKGIAGAIFVAPQQRHRTLALEIVRRGLPVVYWHETPYSPIWGAAPGSDPATRRAKTLALLLDRMFPTNVPVER